MWSAVPVRLSRKAQRGRTHLVVRAASVLRETAEPAWGNPWKGTGSFASSSNKEEFFKRSLHQNATGVPPSGSAGTTGPGGEWLTSYERGLVHLNELVRMAPGNAWIPQQFLRCRNDLACRSCRGVTRSVCLPAVESPTGRNGSRFL